MFKVDTSMSATQPVCTAYTAVTSCNTYDNSGNCNSCVNGFKLNSATPPACVAVTPITNCQTYSTDGTTCVTCKTGFIGTGYAIATMSSTGCGTTAITNCLGVDSSATP